MARLNTKPHRSVGFTLIELIVVVAILAILMSLAAPSFSNLIAAQRVKSAASNLLSDMQFARSQALVRGRSITVAPLNSSWNNGWTISDAATVLKTQSMTPGAVSITKVAGTDDQVVQSANGRSTPPTSNFQLNFTSPALTRDDQKYCLKNSSASGSKLLKGIC